MVTSLYESLIILLSCDSETLTAHTLKIEMEIFMLRCLALAQWSIGSVSILSFHHYREEKLLCDDDDDDEKQKKN